MTDKALLRTRVIGTVVAAVCCFTPLLAALATFLGLAIVGWLRRGRDA